MELKEMVNIVKADKRVLNWVSGLTERAKAQDYYALADLCMITEKNPTETLEIAQKEQETLVMWERSLYDWFTEYDKYSLELNRSRSTMATRKGRIRNFFDFYHIETPRKSKRNGRKFEILNADRELPTSEEIQLFLNSCKNIKQKAIILTQLSSGLSNSDVCSLTVGQFKKGIDNNNICTLKLKRNKTEKRFTTFLSPEAVECIQSYLRIDRKDLNDSQALFTKFKKNDEPMKPKSIVFIYSRLCDSIGWGTDGKKYRKITGHMCRKWFNTKLVMAGMPEEIREHLMGHKIKNVVKDAYYLANIPALKKVYIQYLSHISINPTKTLTLESKEYTELQKQLEENQKEFDQKDKQIEVLQKQMEEMDERLKKSEGFFEKAAKKQKMHPDQLRDIYYNE